MDDHPAKAARRPDIRLVSGAQSNSRKPERKPRADQIINLVEDWVLWQRARGLSAKTITERVAVIRRIPGAATLTPAQVDQFLTSPGWARSTRATYHGAIRAWSKWLITTGRRPDDPTTIATTPKVKKGRPRPIADEHLAVLLDSNLHTKTRAMILLAAYAGLRVSEIAAVRGHDIDSITHTISVIGKGDKRRDIPLHPVLLTLAQTMPDRAWWFPSWTGNHRYQAGGPMLGNSVSACVSKAMNRAGIPGTPHALRHWFGSALRATGVDSLIIKELMGHESLATTAIYVDVPLTQRTAAIDQLPTHQRLYGAPECTIASPRPTSSSQLALFAYPAPRR